MRSFALLTAACLLALPAFAAQGPLVVVLDAGHGGSFPHDGAHGPHGLLEKTVVLSVAQKTKELLEADGVQVVLTRDADLDVPLAERARIANEASADLFLSIHCNSMESRADRLVTRGVETYFLSPDPTDAEAKMLAALENGGPDALPAPKVTDAVSGILADLALGQARNDSAALAEIVQQKVVRGTHAPSRGVRQAPFLVLSGTKMPSALVEIGFISHPQESRTLSRPAYQEKVAQALASAVREFAEKVLARRLVAQSGTRSFAEPAVATERTAAVDAVATDRGTAANAVATTPSAQAPATVPVARPGGTR